MLARYLFARGGLLLWFFASAALEGRAAEDYETFVKPLLEAHCIKCHGGEKVKGEVNLKEVARAEDFLKQPELLKDLISVIDSRDMPPEDEPALDEAKRLKLVASLKGFLNHPATGSKPQAPLHRLTRYQYNNVVRDLFQLRRDIFSLPEKMMTRETDYLRADRMPDKVSVTCRSIRPDPGFQGVNPFPKDLRAAHGFDNQANQLTLSPLLLDSFLKLSLSIVDSPDFNEQNVGLWNDFFKEPPAGPDLRAEISKRLGPFLKQAFRRPVDDGTLMRYTDFAVAQTQRGLSFTASMKRLASAVLSSPMFLYKYDVEEAPDQPYELASRLSFFLWGSSPDAELLRVAESGEISQPEVLDKTITRMMADARIERFLDTFPSQWMRLENVLSATPDPAKARLFQRDRKNNAGTQMVLEPLLLFDAAFVENRPIVELIKPEFLYQSDFLRTWYTSNLQPPVVDPAAVEEENRVNIERSKSQEATLSKERADMDTLMELVRARVLTARRQEHGAVNPADLKPMAEWNFNGSLKDSIGSLDLQNIEAIRYDKGMAIVENFTYLRSGGLPVDLKAKTLEVWCQLHDVKEPGGGLMGIQGPRDTFDSIVFGERKTGHWMSGSNGFVRTEDFADSFPETVPQENLRLTMVYADDGTISLYRNGKLYGSPYRKDPVTFPANESSVLFGLRHLPSAPGKHLRVTIDHARLYDRALTANEAAFDPFVSDSQIAEAMTPEELGQKESLTKVIEKSVQALKAIPKPRDLRKAQEEATEKYDVSIMDKLVSPAFERVPTTDPRYGGILTNAAMATMTSGPDRTHPIARGSWIIEVILNDPPPPPPNDVPPLKEDDSAKDLTIREQFAEHRKNPDCAGCHSRLDPLGFAMENFDITGRWREKYDNGRDVDPSGTLFRKYPFSGVVEFKDSLAKENKRFARAFAGHLLRFALSRELTAADTLAIDSIIKKTEGDNFRMKSLIREVMLSDAFREPR
ncbi:MAG: DUF1588 domain-containing protein [Verrucomicrobiales bacterium]